MRSIHHFRVISATFALAVSFWLLRFGLIEKNLEASLVSLGLPKGMLLDLSVCLFIAAAAQIASSIHSKLKSLIWTLLALGAWGVSFANFSYYSFFKSPIEWWVVATHWKIAHTVADVGGGMALAPLPSLSAVLFLLALLLMLWPASSPSSGHAFGKKDSRAKALLLALPILILGVLAKQSTIWLRNHFPIVSILSYSASIEIPKAAIQTAFSKENSHIREHTLDRMQVQSILSRVAAGMTNESFEGTSEDDWPLYRAHQTSPELTEKLRSDLGLPLEGPINVVIVFGESLRHYEFAHPDYNDAVYSGLLGLASKHAIQFTQAYHSARNAGLTSRGQFSTLCSMYPNFDGVAAYIGFQDLKLQCLMSVFGSEGYRTLWLSSHDRYFFNKAGFESRHGMQLFFDWSYAGSKGIVLDHGWGLEDPNFFEVYFPVFDEFAKKGPVFAHFTTTGTHTPFRIKPDGPLPDRLLELGEYSGFLSRLSAADKGITSLIEKIFSAPYGERTLIVVLGDHGIFIEPKEKLSLMQSREIFFRIPLFFFTKNMRTPGSKSFPVHQVDVAPTISAIAGFSPQASWMGRNLLDGKNRGSTWIFEDQDKISYRNQERGCWYDRSMPEPVCLELTADQETGFHPDPLFWTDLPKSRNSEEEMKFYQRAAKSITAGIEMNWLEP